MNKLNRHPRRVEAANADDQVKPATAAQVARAERASIAPLFARVSVGARVLDMSRSSVYELINKGFLPVARINGKLRIPMAALQRLADEALKAPAGSAQETADE